MNILFKKYFQNLTNILRTSNLEDTLNVVETTKKETNLKVTILRIFK